MDFKPSIYQRIVFNKFKNSDKNLIISAVAGSGKTTTIVSCIDFIPKGKDSKIKVWTYKVTEAGEIVIDKVIAENVSEPILIKAETAEVVPKVGIEYEGNNQKIVLPLILSGKDGKIILGEKSNLIKDISEY